MKSFIKVPKSLLIVFLIDELKFTFQSPTHQPLRDHSKVTASMVIKLSKFIFDNKQVHTKKEGSSLRLISHKTCNKNFKTFLMQRKRTKGKISSD